jgi:cyclase
MRRLLAAGLFGLLLFVAFAREAESQGGAVRQLAPGVFFRQGDRDRRQQANCGWVVFRDYVLVIDANFPWGAREILPEIQKTTNKPIRFVFDTHYHGDHAQGNSVFVDAGATVVASEDAAAESRSKGQKAWDSNTETGEFSLKPYRLEHPSLVFASRMVFDDAVHRVELHKVGPGHSQGDAVAYLPKEGIVFTGDLCTNWTFGNFMGDPDGSHPGWMKALDTMLQWNPQTVVPGHGSLGTVETLRGQQAYISDMWKQVTAGKRAGKSADRLVKEIDLSGHGNFAAFAPRNEESIRAMYAKAPAR